LTTSVTACFWRRGAGAGAGAGSGAGAEGGRGGQCAGGGGGPGAGAARGGGRAPGRAASRAARAHATQRRAARAGGQRAAPIARGSIEATRRAACRAGVPPANTPGPRCPQQPTRRGARAPPQRPADRQAAPDAMPAQRPARRGRALAALLALLACASRAGVADAGLHAAPSQTLSIGYGTLKVRRGARWARCPLHGRPAPGPQAPPRVGSGRAAPRGACRRDLPHPRPTRARRPRTCRRRSGAAR
jgi:hypothetical protein